MADRRFTIGDVVYLGDGKEGVILGYGPFNDYLVKIFDEGVRDFYTEEELYSLSLPDRVARIEERLGLER